MSGNNSRTSRALRNKPEMLMPETPQPHPSVFLDTLMMAYATGQERKRNHYQALLEAAGLRLDRVIPTESAMAILESTPV